MRPPRLRLEIGVARGAWRKGDAATKVADAEFSAKRRGILARDGDSCRFCDVPSEDAIEVHHLDGNHTHNTEENLVGACVFCHPVNHLGNTAQRAIAPSESVGQYGNLLLLEGISQVDLSHLMRTIGYVLKHGSSEQKEEAEALYYQLASHSTYFESVFGSIKPRNVAQALAEVSDDTYLKKVPRVFGAVRVLFKQSAAVHLAERFSKQFQPFPMASWPQLAAQHLKGSSRH